MSVYLLVNAIPVSFCPVCEHTSGFGPICLTFLGARLRMELRTTPVHVALCLASLLAKLPLIVRLLLPPSSATALYVRKYFWKS